MATINRPFGVRRPIPAPHVRLPGINGWVLAGIVVVGIGAMLPVLQNSLATSQGFDVQRMQAEQARLNGDIQLMEADVARLSSLDRIQRRAVQIGLIPGDDPIFVQVSEPGPAPAKIPSEYLPGPVPNPDSPDSWWRSLLRWVSLRP
ncbi:MAG: hypothetical protein HYX53_08950 [Chloroflexi bacterium]|nr:hypothetical protein [Chloroflexota bacterium]